MIRRSLLSCFLPLLFLMVTLSFTSSASAQVFPSDFLFDYDVYSKLPGTQQAFFVEITRDDGSIDEWGPYASRSSAQLAIFRAVERGQNVDWRSTRIVDRQIPYRWRFVQRFDRYADANNLQFTLLASGLMVEIRSVYSPPRLKLPNRIPFGNLTFN